MCRPVVCPDCNKADWRGCGAHVEQVLGHVPKNERCKCREKAYESVFAGAPADAPKR